MFSKKPKINFLTLIPERNVSEHTEEQGKIILLVPRFKNKTLLRLFTGSKRSPFVKVTLDETGSEIWRLIDGKRTVEEISTLLVSFLKEKNKSSDQVEERVTQFLSALNSSRFVKLVVRS